MARPYWHCRSFGRSPGAYSTQRDRATRHGTCSWDIELVQPTGSRTFVEFKLGDSTTVAELQAHDVQRSGERIAVDVDMNRVILIDPTIEQVIANGRQH